jgi:hypothetical protein
MLNRRNLKVETKDNTAIIKIATNVQYPFNLFCGTRSKKLKPVKKDYRKKLFKMLEEHQ